jgi:hypothetical protein
MQEKGSFKQFINKIIFRLKEKENLTYLFIYKLFLAHTSLLYIRKRITINSYSIYNIYKVIY